MQWKWFTAGSAACKKIHSGAHIEYIVGTNAPSLIPSPAVCTLEYSVTVECSSLWWPCFQYCTNGLVTAALGTGGLSRRRWWWWLDPACQQLLSVCRVVVILTLPQGSGFSRHWGLVLSVSATVCLTHLSSSSELPPPQKDCCEMKHWLPCRLSRIHNYICPPPPKKKSFQRLDKSIKAIWLIFSILDYFWK